MNDSSVIDALKEVVHEITPENWRAYAAHAIKEENKYRVIDEAWDNGQMERIVINPNSSSSESSSDDSDFDEY